MTDAVVLAIVAGVPAMMAAAGSLTAIILAQINARNAESTRQQLAAKADEKADRTITLVNGRMSDVIQQLASSRAEVEALKHLVQEYGRDAADLQRFEALLRVQRTAVSQADTEALRGPPNAPTRS